jgi:hypothetical protein
VSQVTPLASGRVIRSGHDVISIELHEPDDRPAFPIIGTPPTFVRITCPLQSTIVNLKKWAKASAAELEELLDSL